MKNNEKKHIFGAVKVGEKGQIVIPKAARDIFNIKPGDSLMVLGDEDQGIAIVKSNIFLDKVSEIMKSTVVSKDTLTDEEKNIFGDLIK